MPTVFSYSPYDPRAKEASGSDPSSDTSKQREIPIRLRELYDLVGCLDTNLQELRTRLLPVIPATVATPTADAPMETEPQSSTELGRAIENQISRIQRLNREVLALRDAIQT